MDNTANRTPEIDWQSLHELIQSIFLSFAELVQAECPSIRSRAGKTQTPRFPLFSYRRFEVPSQPNFDPVVMGITFNPDSSGRGISLQADLCGEETGRIWYELPEQTVSATQDALYAAAETLARMLSEQKDRIFVALNQQNTLSPHCLGRQDGAGIVTKDYERRS